MIVAIPSLKKSLFWGDVMGYNFNKEHEVYYNVLEDIRKSGVCNMYGAVPYLMYECPELEKLEAKQILLEWMSNYEELCEMYERQRS